ncbi:Rha family transcriptional regulator [Paenibacillus popilliae]|uniref:Uncharacterized phage-encoded protein n=1 Tax=Paenibacillus popilliae ATCC 14706 TaxID=1212764 RepID=M9LAQ8_PAEPP|nr:Rha family transcriptional regulator [Paenibacillus popilliae]GAC42777.1 uncharacterized phage-encoded protein [Paenibacillus popilliae ATCC 14706]
MNQLVFVSNGRAVTDSLTVAEVFEKAHDKVLRDIRELGCSDEFRLSNFGASVYVNGQGREMPKYLITEKGFTLLAMGYTGQKAMEFKERYIAEFEGMRQQLQNGVPVLSPQEAMAVALQQTAEMMKAVPKLENRIETVEQKVDEQITLNSGEQRRLQKAVNTKVCSIEPDKELRTGLFRQLHREIKDRWGVPSYKDVRRQDLQGALRYVDAWLPKKAN